MRRSTSEPAAKGRCGRLYRQPAHGIGKPASGTGHTTRSRPQDSASNAAAPQWEPRAALDGRRKPRRETETPAGPKWDRKRELAQDGPPTSFNPSDQSRKRILYKKGPSAKPGP